MPLFSTSFQLGPPALTPSTALTPTPPLVPDIDSDIDPLTPPTAQKEGSLTPPSITRRLSDTGAEAGSDNDEEGEGASAPLGGGVARSSLSSQGSAGSREEKQADTPLLNAILSHFPLHDDSVPRVHTSPPAIRTTFTRLRTRAHAPPPAASSSFLHSSPASHASPSPPSSTDGTPPRTRKASGALQPFQRASLGHAPASLPRTSPVPPPAPASAPVHSRHTHTPGHSMDNPGPGSPGAVQRRLHASPSRHHHGLSALSALQGLSPMQSPRAERPSHARSISGDVDARHRNSAHSSPGANSTEAGHSRTSSITRSLSRRQSLIHSAAAWTEGKAYTDENLTNPSALFSRLTLVKAPAADQQEQGLRRRSKSSSALAPIGGGLSQISQSLDIPATSARAPRRSFASSFNTLSPITPAVATAKPATQSGSYTPGGSDAVHRISSIYSSDNKDGSAAKSYTPNEVVELARGLASPVMVPEGGFKGAELKRRKSAGASFSRSPFSTSLSMSPSTSAGNLSAQSTPEKPPMALEPVEYVQLDDDMLLPFIDRPAEVADLIKHPSNEKMFELLRATFPKGAARRNWQEIAPEQWTWDEVILHLTEIDRIECGDLDWVFRARQAVRQRSVALWEKVGVCLGCNDRLLNLGGEDGPAQTWGGLEGEDEDDGNGGYTYGSQVWIEGLQPIDPDERARAERDFVEGFGEIVEDDPTVEALLDTIGEGDEGTSGAGAAAKKGQTTAQRAGTRYQRDPLLSPLAGSGSARLFSAGAGGAAQRGSGAGATAIGGKNRTKSFVGLTIVSSSPASAATGTSPPNLRRSTSLSRSPLSPDLPLSFSPQFPRSPMLTPGLIPAHSEGQGPTLDRGPGSTLFPSSFSTLSAEPNLGRAASGLIGGLKPVPVESQFEARGADWRKIKGLGRKASGTGLSESAITFASESDYAHSLEHHD